MTTRTMKSSGTKSGQLPSNNQLAEPYAYLIYANGSKKIVQEFAAELKIM